MKEREAPIEYKMREATLKRVRDIKIRDINAPVRRCEMIDISASKRDRGRPTKN